jgi:arsenate reductase (glutaredoxin)
MSLTMYHNPRCSKSRATLELLTRAGQEVIVVPYLEQAPDAGRIQELARRLGLPVTGLVRESAEEFRSADDLPDLADDAALAAWLSRNPGALQRPIVADDERGLAAIGRPPENVLSLLE